MRLAPNTLSSTPQASEQGPRRHGAAGELSGDFFYRDARFVKFSELYTFVHLSVLYFNTTVETKGAVCLSI